MRHGHQRVLVAVARKKGGASAAMCDSGEESGAWPKYVRYQVFRQMAALTEVSAFSKPGWKAGSFWVSGQCCHVPAAELPATNSVVGSARTHGGRRRPRLTIAGNLTQGAHGLDQEILTRSRTTNGIDATKPATATTRRAAGRGRRYWSSPNHRSAVRR